MTDDKRNNGKKKLLESARTFCHQQSKHLLALDHPYQSPGLGYDWILYVWKRIPLHIISLVPFFFKHHFWNDETTL